MLPRFANVVAIHTFCLVADINRVAAVVQAVTKKDGMLYGMYRASRLLTMSADPWHVAASDSRKRGRAAGH